MNKIKQHCQVHRDFSRNVVSVMGIPVDALSMSDAGNYILDAIASKSSTLLSTPNLNFMLLTKCDSEFQNSLIQSDLVTLDGVPLIWISKLLGINGLEKVSGSNLFEHLMKRQTNNPIRAYLFGGDKGIAHAAHSAINLSASGVVSSGFNNPGFGTAEQLCSKQNLDKINKLQPDFLIISLGAQKGQEWLLRSRGQLDAPVKSHLGAVLNFSAGSVRRAPKVLQDLGLEWLWRIKEQPHLFKRYWADGIGLIHFVFTKVLPYANLKRNSLKRLKSATAEQQYKFSYSFEQDGATRMTIKLDGVLNYQNHRYMRQCFEKAAAYNEVILNMKDVKYIDEYGFGLILLLLKYVGDNLKVTLYSDSVGKAFEYEGLAFMLSRG